MRLTVRALSVLLAFAVVCLPLHRAFAANNPYLNAGLRLYGDLEYEAALEQLKKAASFPGNTPADDVTIALYSGMIRFELGDKSGAESDFKTAVSLDENAALPGKVSPKVQALFDKAKADILKTKPPKPVAQPTPPVTTPPPVVTTPPPANPPPTAHVTPPPANPPPQQQVIIKQPPSQATPSTGSQQTVAMATPDSMHSIDIKTEKPPEVKKASGPKVLPFALLGVGVVLGGVGGYFGYQSGQSVAAARDAQFQSDAVNNINSAESQALTANLMYGAAAVAVISGLVTMFVGGGNDEPVRPAAVESGGAE